jgi:hypothetical protein
MCTYVRICGYFLKLEVVCEQKNVGNTELLNNFALDCFSKVLDRVFQRCILPCILRLIHNIKTNNMHFN